MWVEWHGGGAAICLISQGREAHCWGSDGSVLTLSPAVFTAHSPWPKLSRMRGGFQCPVSWQHGLYRLQSIKHSYQMGNLYVMCEPWEDFCMPQILPWSLKCHMRMKPEGPFAQCTSWPPSLLLLPSLSTPHLFFLNGESSTASKDDITWKIDHMPSSIGVLSLN